MSDIRTAQIWEMKVFQALERSSLDAILKIALRMMMYNRTSDGESEDIVERVNT